MTFATYADLYRLREVRRILLLGFLFRVPTSASGVLVTLHVVTHLHRSYAEAGVVTTVLAVALALSSPWRGRVLDRAGLRRTIAPSLVVLATAWTVSPWVPYWPLVLLVAGGGLFMIPSFSIARQVLLGAVAPAQRTAALSLDSMVTEISFMLGPILGVLGATYLPTPVAMLICNLALVGSGLALLFVNPPLRSESTATAGTEPAVPRREWMTPSVVLLLAVTFTASLILVSEDLGSVAAMRSMHHSSALGLVMALWALGSLLGALVYGALQRHPPAPLLLVLLGASTALVSVATGPILFTGLLVLSGLFCATTLTATVDDLARLVPASVRGELMGWHGSALTLGSAAGAPLVGLAIDAGGWSSGFLLGGLVGGLVGLAIAAVVLLARRRLPRSETISEAFADVAPPPPVATPAPDSTPV